ncbi:MAG: phosphatase PAP2 family protein [Myxococcota bacterium]
MLEASFNLDLIQFLFENRTPTGTTLFALFTFLGEIEGYVLVVSLVHVAYDKGLALRLAVLALVTMSVNHFVKTVIANPRPFIDEGTYAEKWAVSEAKAAELAPEYSTPSGHAMTGSCFYTYLCACVKSRSVRIASIGMVLLSGLSRPYLGVHYLEDVLLGWALGIPVALFALRFGAAIGNAWSRLSLPHRALIVVAASIGSWLVSSPLYDSNVHGQPLPFVSYLGFLAGIVLAYPLEARWVAFEPRSSTALHKALRLAISVSLVLGSLLLLDGLFGTLASDASLLGNALRFVRYAVAGTVGVLLCPFLFVSLGLAGTTPPEETLERRC